MSLARRPAVHHGDEVQLPLALERLLEAEQIAGRRGELRRLDLDVVEPDHRVEVELADVEALPHDLPVDLALGRDVDHDVAANVGGAAEPAASGQTLGPVVLGFDRAGRGQVVGGRDDAVLGKLAHALLDLAASADPAPAADRIDVHAELAGGVEDRRPRLESAAPAGRREDDERFVGHRDVAVAGPLSRATAAASVPAIRCGGSAPARRRLTRRPPASPSGGATRN